MAKSHKVLIILLIVIATLFATSTGFFYSRNVSLEKKVNNSNSTNSNTITNTAATTTTPTTSSSSSAGISISPLNNRPSSPTETVTVEKDETLFAIGQKVGVSWTELANVNGIDANKIKAGDIIVVPKNNQVSYTVNSDKVSALQKEADSGKSTYRFSALDTAKSDISPIYGLVPTDVFTQTKIDNTSGTAEILAKKGDKTYTISLSQPGTKGAKGIWAIISIK